MSSGYKYFTSESVLPGHPDKIADQISDLVLDMYMQQDSKNRAAVETLVTASKIIIAGEVRSERILDAELDFAVRKLLKEIGYSVELFDWENIEISNLLSAQSPEICKGVESSCSYGAGDQGIMFGYASNETPTLMPAPIYYARCLLAFIKEKNPLLGPDGKSQVTVRYDAYGVPQEIENVVVSIQHPGSMSVSEIRELLRQDVREFFSNIMPFKQDQLFINTAGEFTLGGPRSDCGLTGRKIVVDTYGGMVPNGGGAFSGKDATKVDRSAAYLARYIAKNIVKAGFAQRASVQLCYAIGVDRPLNFQLCTHGTSTIPDEMLHSYIAKKIDFSPMGMIKLFNLEQPIFLQTAKKGHFGFHYEEGSQFFKWEDVDLFGSDGITELLK